MGLVRHGQCDTYTVLDAWIQRDTLRHRPWITNKNITIATTHRLSIKVTSHALHIQAGNLWLSIALIKKRDVIWAKQHKVEYKRRRQPWIGEIRHKVEQSG